jgi:hypothetical protein
MHMDDYAVYQDRSKVKRCIVVVPNVSGFPNTQSHGELSRNELPTL